MANFNDPAQWEDYLTEFVARNQARPSRFERFAEGEAAEEQQLALLESITVEEQGNNAPRIVISRRDTTSPDQRLLTDAIAHVRSISPQLDQDGSEFGLRIEDEDNVVTILRLQSTLDGDS